VRLILGLRRTDGRCCVKRYCARACSPPSIRQPSSLHKSAAISSLRSGPDVKETLGFGSPPCAFHDNCVLGWMLMVMPLVFPDLRHFPTSPFSLSAICSGGFYKPAGSFFQGPGGERSEGGAVTKILKAWLRCSFR